MHITVETTDALNALIDLIQFRIEFDDGKFEDFKHRNN